MASRDRTPTLPKGALPSFIPSLEGLRAVSAYGIIVTHVAFQTGQSEAEWYGRLLGRADFFVPVFFALSGFLLWRRHRTDTKWGSYLVKRVGRIVPALWVYLFFIIFLLPPGHMWGALDPYAGRFEENILSVVQRIESTLGTFFLVQNLQPFPMINGTGHLWSLGVEMAFYLSLPIIAICLRWMRPLGRVAFIIAAGACSYAWAWQPFLPHYPVNHEINAQVLPPAFMAWFGVGMLAAEAEHARAVAILREAQRRGITIGDGSAGTTAWADLPVPSPWRGVDRLCGMRWLWIGVAVVAYWVASQPWWGAVGFVHLSPEEFARRLLAGTIFGGALIFPYAVRPGSRVLDSALMQTLGRWSYAVFLWHMGILMLVPSLLGITMNQPDTFILVYVVTAALTTVVSAASFALVEEPARRWVNSWWSAELARMAAHKLAKAEHKAGHARVTVERVDVPAAGGSAGEKSAEAGGAGAESAKVDGAGAGGAGAESAAAEAIAIEAAVPVDAEVLSSETAEHVRR